MGDNMFTCTYRPWLRFVTDTETGGGSNADTSNEPAFPANTPVKDMTAEQQAAYWQYQSRKHEDRVKSFGDYTPDTIASLVQERDTLRTASQTDQEKAVDEAREAGRAEVRSILAAERVKTAFEKALNGRVPDAGALLDLDRTQFVKGDAADLDAITAWVNDHSTESTSSGKGHVDLGQGRDRGTNAPNKGVSAGRELFTGSKSNKS
ncbi:hypothetical protein [Curtobacterium sp. MCBA15_004]|uniref:hypothetical protein n=1 Tax=Curtobacterium sp. MCBA15_004 TaxID=1898733 RepID=UPI001114EA12|nr:hypothetical protein [Curtobacterium sp. MCBA15_004]WIA95809.1 hypothetical protein QOL16_11885 [Curtobacterium sp. MCBA15_004]